MLEAGFCGKEISQELLQNRQKVLENLRGVLLNKKKFKEMKVKPQNIDSIMDAINHKENEFRYQLEVLNKNIEPLEREFLLHTILK